LTSLHHDSQQSRKRWSDTAKCRKQLHTKLYGNATSNSLWLLHKNSSSALIAPHDIVTALPGGSYGTWAAGKAAGGSKSADQLGCCVPWSLIF